MFQNLRIKSVVTLIVAAGALAGCMSVLESVPMEVIGEREYLEVSAKVGTTAKSSPACLKNYEKDEEAGFLAWGCSYALNDLADRYEFDGDQAAADAFVVVADRIVEGYNTDIVDAYRGTVTGGWVSKKYTDGNPHVLAVHTGMIAHPLARFATLVAKRGDARYAENARRYLDTAAAAYRAMEPDWADGSYRSVYTTPHRIKGSPLPANMLASMGLLAHNLEQAGSSGNYSARIKQISKRIDDGISSSFSSGKHKLVWKYDYLSGAEDVSHAILTMRFITVSYERKVITRDRFQLILASFLNEAVGKGTKTLGTLEGGDGGIDFKSTCRRALPIYRYSAPTFRRCQAEG